MKSLHAEARRCATLFPKQSLSVLARIIAGIFETIKGSFLSRLEQKYSNDLFVAVTFLTMTFLSALELLLANVAKKGKKEGNLRLTSLAAMDTELEQALLIIIEPIEEKIGRYEDPAITELLKRFDAVTQSKNEFLSKT